MKNTWTQLVFGFKNADQFCLVSTDQPNDIHTYLQ